MSMKVHVFKGKDGDWYWSAVARNGEIAADSSEGYVDRAYCVKKAIERNPDAELVIDDNECPASQSDFGSLA